ncbi:hypothetical protein B0H17DRAFT_1217284 [Mycena rosella]|uniref:Uncharacterized protein n=1 Tax=Mycena rosella TaxID=1033263 RepID=A0AAD7C0L5_MYCRO|nr:hypothetical protein B0H17DRAFT_1217284 [Mycena rosella]
MDNEHSSPVYKYLQHSLSNPSPLSSHNHPTCAYPSTTHFIVTFLDSMHLYTLFPCGSDCRRSAPPSVQPILSSISAFLRPPARPACVPRLGCSSFCNALHLTADVADASEEEEEEEEEEEPPSNPFLEPPTHTRPTDYLISRCPACFGGLVHDPTQLVDIQVCVDACFTQKRRRRGARDPPRTHPNSLFAQKATADQMGVHVDEVRPARGRSAKKARTQAEEEDDKYEGASLKVPRSVLNECKSSFKAADDKREKASTKFFDDTGSWAYSAAMIASSGSSNAYTPARQHPDRYLDRILFAVSVFHAFGHRWPCQLIYYPLKCCGFGFTNGEGCERFWHSISKLISYLRVAGYHHRLFTIDLQIEHADKASLGRLASWLLRGQRTARANCAMHYQIAVQTKPVARRSKMQGQAAVEQVLEARQRAQQLFERVASLEEALADEFCMPEVSLYARMNLDDARTAWKQGKDKAVRLEQQLGIDDTTQLNKLKHSKYYALQMNGRAVKERLRAKLRDRKFELDPIERSFRRTRSENQRNEHAGAAIKRREPNIARLVKEYNKICDQIEALIKAKKAPARAGAPVPMPAKGIYQLDVDDVIWQDLGLDGDEEGAPPLWLQDDKVRLGIRALLQKDRCHEEAPRLLRERSHLQIWFTTEWRAVNEALKASTGGVCYQFELRGDELLQLYVLWKKSLDQMPFDDVHLPEWGPTDAQILACQIAGVTASWAEYDSDGGEEEEDDDDDDDDDLFQILQVVERADNHRGGEKEEENGWASEEDFFA